jgi:hypothetical protein
MPPPYVRHADGLEGDKLVAIGPVVRGKRGGCKRIGFLVLLAVIAIGLGIGLGVGLTRGGGGGPSWSRVGHKHTVTVGISCGRIQSCHSLEHD